MDTTSPIAALIAKTGWVVDARNCVLGLEGGYVKRDGYASQITAWSTRKITGGIEYKDISGSKKTIIYGTDGSASGGIIGWNNAGTATSLVSSLSGTTRPSFIQFRDLLMFFNGADTPQVYDGTAFRQVGITPPSIAPTISSQTTGGSLTLLGTYLWFYTYYNSITGAESSPSAASPSTTLTGANCKVVLGLTAGSATTADKIRIYRTVANGAQAFLEDTVGVSVTSYNSITADAGLGIAMEIDNTRITTFSTTAKYPQVADNRVFLVTGTNEVRWSKIGQSGAMPESFQVSGRVDTMGSYGSNDPVVGLGKAYGSFGFSSPTQMPIVLKQSSMGRLERINAPDPTNPSDGVFYLYYEISDKVGAVSHFAGCAVNNEWVFLGRDNVYATDGYKVRSVADPIQATIKSLGFASTQTNFVSAINDTKNMRVLISVFGSATASSPSYIICGDYRKYPDFRWTWHTPGTNTTTHPGINAASLFHVQNPVDGSLDVYFGNSAANGKLYLLGNGATDDDGKGIYWKIIDRPRAMQKPLNDKLFHDVRISVLGSGATYNLTCTAIFDLSNTEEISTPFSLEVTGSRYGSALYGTGTYALPAVFNPKYNLHRYARYMQPVFYQTDANAPVTLYNWGVTASISKVS